MHINRSDLNEKFCVSFLSFTNMGYNFLFISIFKLSISTKYVAPYSYIVG